jgi:hypothetical protein
MTAILHWLRALFRRLARRPEDEARDPQQVHARDAAARHAARAAEAGIHSLH